MPENADPAPAYTLNLDHESPALQLANGLREAAAAHGMAHGMSPLAVGQVLCNVLGVWTARMVEGTSLPPGEKPALLEKLLDANASLMRRVAAATAAGANDTPEQAAEWAAHTTRPN